MRFPSACGAVHCGRRLGRGAVKAMSTPEVTHRRTLLDRISALLHHARRVFAGQSMVGILERVDSEPADRAARRVSGWVFSQGGRVVSATVCAGDVELGTLSLGQSREDVARVFGHRPGSATSGFSGVIRLPETSMVPLTVKVIDNDGRSLVLKAKQQPRHPSPLARPTIHIDDTFNADGEHVIRGWLEWFEGHDAAQARAFIKGQPAATLTLGLSRPDIGRRFPHIPEAIRSGFSVTCAAVAGCEDLELLLELTATAGHSVSARTRVTLPATVSRARWPEEIMRLAARPGRGLTALDLTSHHEGPTSNQTITYLRPVSPELTPQPYREASIDIVAIDADALDRLEDARRIAAVAVCLWDSDSVQVEWRTKPVEGPLVRVSVVIPVRGRFDLTHACINRVLQTRPHGWHVEIIVVNDASKDETKDRLDAWAQTEPGLTVVSNETTLGFGESCNRGARFATGTLLVFLNNDTLPREGWLEALIAPIDDPSIGAVGAKLVYPDGHLQEAGGVIFSDGTGWNFGRMWDPDLPVVNHRRDVDYCSAAALATRRELFLELGGFASEYAPAYYEDTDYCFALRRAGRRVVYQPRAVVVHLEGATAGSETSGGAKRFQAVNRSTFRARWRTELAMHRQAPARTDLAAMLEHVVRDSRVRRVLVWVPVLPEHDRESGSRRMHDLVRYLRDAGWAVTLVAESAGVGSKYRRTLEDLGVSVYAGQDTSWAGAEFLDDPATLVSGGQFDLVLFGFWWVAERHLELVRRYAPNARIVVDSVDLHFLRQLRIRLATDARWSDTSADATFSDEFVRELRTYARADAVLTVSEREASRLAELLPGAHVRCVPDAESPFQAAPGREQRHGLLFVGNFRHPPNVDALEYLAREIVPALPPTLLARHPVTVVGTDLTLALAERVGALKPGIILTGWVPDVYPYIAGALMTLAPLRAGAGTKRKVIQAAVAGTPTVSSSFGVEGLPLTHDCDVLVADDPVAFAGAIVSLADDPQRWSRIADAGLRLASIHSHERARRALLDAVERPGL